MGWFANVLNIIATAIGYFVKFQGVFGWLIPILGLAMSLFGWFNTVFDKLFALISTIPAVSNNFPAFNVIAIEYWNKINTYIPLDIMFSTTAVYVTLLVTCSIIRIIKSFIPTIS